MAESSIDVSIATIENIIDELKRNVSRMHDAEWNLLNTIGERRLHRYGNRCS